MKPAVKSAEQPANKHTAAAPVDRTAMETEADEDEEMQVYRILSNSELTLSLLCCLIVFLTCFSKESLYPHCNVCSAPRHTSHWKSM